MASTRQIAANKRNASLPRGPLSEAAAAAIRENPLKHGLTAKHVVLASKTSPVTTNSEPASSWSIFRRRQRASPGRPSSPKLLAITPIPPRRNRDIREPSRLAQNPPERRPRTPKSTTTKASPSACRITQKISTRSAATKRLSKKPGTEPSANSEPHKKNAAVSKPSKPKRKPTIHRSKTP